MKTTARVRANRRNARQSTGPRSRAGKKRVARNALRHGLAIPIASLRVADATVEHLARLIAGEDFSQEYLEFARRVAETQVDLNRVRRARAALIAKPMADANDPQNAHFDVSVNTAVNAHSRRDAPFAIGTVDESVSRLDGPVPSSEAERVSTILGDLSKDLTRLDRYERRALSRRKFAIREMDSPNLRQG